MAAPHSIDLRKRTIQVYQETGSIYKTGERLLIAPSTSSKLNRHVKKTGSIKPKKQGRTKGGGQLEMADIIIEMVINQKPERTIEQIAAATRRFLPCIGKIKRSTMHRKLQEMGYSFKVMERLPEEALKAGAKARRGLWIRTKRPYLNKNIRLTFFLDEFGTNTKMARKRGWGRRGQRVQKRVPHGHWNSQTCVLCVGMSGVVATRVFRGPMNGRLFCWYVKNVLIKALPRGAILVMDNLSSHKNRQALRLLDEAGIEVVFLPTYRMDLNPAEYCISKVKSSVEKKQPRTLKEVRRAVYSIARRITEEECANYIRASGYRVPATN